LLMSPMTAASISAAPGGVRGQASGLVSATRQLGGILGVGVFAAIAGSHPSAAGAAAGFAVAAAVIAVGGLVTTPVLARDA
jgi:MFS transporter, DHA2 family, methylenomycin A resistance protein